MNREIVIKNYEEYILWLAEQPATHRYFKHWTEKLEVRTKGEVLAELNSRLDRIKSMTDSEYSKIEDCPLCLLWHNQSTDIIELHNLFGGMKARKRFVENEDGSQANMYYEIIDDKNNILYSEDIEDVDSGCC
jgi:hypothetical protein